MTIKTFIEKAIEGGWDAEKSLAIAFFEKAPPSVKALALTKREYVSMILLDPLAWQAVGKVEGWGELPEKHWGQESPIPLYQWQMHRLTDALIAGKTIEEYLATL